LTLYGDRTLAIFLHDHEFVFATYDLNEKKKNIAKPVILNEDIESMWYFITFTYSSHKKKAVGFVAAYGNGNKVYRTEIICNHIPP